MNEWQAREGEEMSLREEALMLWETLSDVCGLLWSGHVMDHLQCLDKELLCALFFFFLSHLNGKLGGSYRNSVGAQTLMGVHGNHSQT